LNLEKDKLPEAGFRYQGSEMNGGVGWGGVGWGGGGTPVDKLAPQPGHEKAIGEREKAIGEKTRNLEENKLAAQPGHVFGG